MLADGYTHWQTDANRFYNLSHAICYSYICYMLWGREKQVKIIIIGSPSAVLFLSLCCFWFDFIAVNCMNIMHYRCNRECTTLITHLHDTCGEIIATGPHTVSGNAYFDDFSKRQAFECFHCYKQAHIVRCCAYCLFLIFLCFCFRSCLLHIFLHVCILFSFDATTWWIKMCIIIERPAVNFVLGAFALCVWEIWTRLYSVCCVASRYFSHRGVGSK